MLTDAQKDDVRRHCGFPVYGAQDGTASPPTFGYRYYEQYLIMEYRLNNLSPNQEAILINQYLAPCNTLFTAIQTASQNLDTAVAAVWTHNKNEVRDRYKLYEVYCDLLLDYLGLVSPSASEGSYRFVV